MRLDKFLKVSRLIKRRTVANEACDAGRVMVNDKPAKASAQVKPGDVIEIQFGTRTVKAEVLKLQDTTKKEEMRMEEQRTAKPHKLVLNNRKTSMVTGVLDVLSFDLNEILLETELGMLMVKGTDLHVNRLSVEKGEVDLSGNIDSIAYSGIAQTGKRDGGFMARLFK